jgi:hypothetical protein
MLTQGGTYLHVGSRRLLTVLEQSGGLVRVRRGETDEFWTRTGELVDPAAGNDEVFIAQLRRQGYTLIVHVADDEFLHVAQAEYAVWTVGERLEDEYVLVRPHATHAENGESYRREWKLMFKLNPDLCIPFPTRLMGTAEGSHQDAANAAGLINMTNGQVYVNWTSLIRPLVEKGLRASRRK